MKNLREIAKIRNEILGQIFEKSGELTPEMEDALTITTRDQTEKIDSTKYVLDMLDKDEEYFKEKAHEFDLMAKRIFNTKKRIKDGIKFVMNELNLKEISGNDYKFVLSQTIGKLVIDNENEVPQEFKTIVQTSVINNDRLKGEILLGRDVPGAHVENGNSVRAYITTKEKKE